jgi:Skp family chaperone for outer membrane proteins
MNRILILFMAVGLMIATAACQQNQDAAQAPAGAAVEAPAKIGVVNAQRVITESEAGKKAMEMLRSESENLQTTIAELQAEIAELEEGTPETQARAEELQQKMAEYQMLMQVEQNRLVAVLNTNFEEVMEEYRTANNYDILIPAESVLSYNTEVEATDALIEAMNARDIEITPSVDNLEGAAPEMAPETEAAPAEGEAGS